MPRNMAAPVTFRSLFVIPAVHCAFRSAPDESAGSGITSTVESMAVRDGVVESGEVCSTVCSSARVHAQHSDNNTIPFHRRGEMKLRVVVMLLLCSYAAADEATAQSVLERTPNLTGGWTG